MIVCIACVDSQTTRLPLVGYSVHHQDPLLHYSVEVALRVKHGDKVRYSRCSGTLLTPQLVLTAAHCMVGTHAAIVKHTADKILAQPVKAYVHPPSYTKGASEFSFASWNAGLIVLQTLFKPFANDGRVQLKDLAILEVAEPFVLPYELNYLRPASLPDLSGQHTTLVGYGIGTSTMRGGILRKARVAVHADAKFSDVLEFKNFLNRINFGDSGGGVWWYDQDDNLNLVGIHAMAVPLFNFHYFAVDIRQHHDWITLAMRYLQGTAPPVADMRAADMEKSYPTDGSIYLKTAGEEREEGNAPRKQRNKH